MKQSEWHESVDVVVVGSGAAGLTAAYTAGQSGLRTLLLEKTAYFGGTTAFSGSGIWLPGNEVLREAGLEDSVELGYEYLHSLVGDRTPASLQRVYVETGPEVIRFLRESPWLDFIHVPFPDYFPGKGRFDNGRAIFPAETDRVSLGAAADDVRPPAAVSTFGITAGHPQQQLSGGQALVGRFIRAIADVPQIELRTNSPVVELIWENGHVAGVVVEQEGQQIRVRAQRGVVLAAGGFEANDELRRTRQGIPGASWTSGPAAANTGELIDAAVELGAATDLLEEAWWVPAVLFPNGAAAFVVGVQGGIFVGPDGRRFANELKPYDQMGHAIKAYYDAKGGHQPIWWIFDARHPGPPSLMQPPADEASFREAGLWRSAPTIEGLAGQIGVAPDALTETLARFNRFADAGTDEDFHRAEDPYDVFFVGGSSKLALARVSEGPFHAVQVVLGDLGTKGGLCIDADARVVTASGEPLPGLFAAGNTAASVTGTIYPGPGAPIGTGMVWGYRAARFLAEQESGDAVLSDPVPAHGVGDRAAATG